MVFAIDHEPTRRIRRDGMFAGDVAQVLAPLEMPCHYCRVALRWSTGLDRYVPTTPTGGLTCPERTWPRRRHTPYEPHPLDLGDITYAMAVMLAVAAIVAVVTYIAVTR